MEVSLQKAKDAAENGPSVQDPETEAKRIVRQADHSSRTCDQSDRRNHSDR